MTLEEVKKTKDRLYSIMKNKPWFEGIGIYPMKEGYRIRINTNMDEKDFEFPIPMLIDDTRVQIVNINKYS